MSGTVRMMKIADVHPDEVAEFTRHGWVAADDAERLDEDAPTQARGNDKKPEPKRGAKK